MSNVDKLFEIFSKALILPLEQITDDLAYNTITQWDSVGHMMVIMELESAFEVMLDTDDIIAMSTVGKAKEILAKYGVEF